MTDLGELIDATPWIDTHEHLVEERHALRREPYVISTTADRRA